MLKFALLFLSMWMLHKSQLDRVIAMDWQLGQVGQVGHFGQVGHLGQVGQVGHLGQVGQPGQSGEFSHIS